MTNRTEKRKEKMHTMILDTASDLIYKKGSSAVSLDEISKYADIARKTIYNHFDNKSALIHELVMPLCNHSKQRLIDMQNQKDVSTEDIWSYCLELWYDRSLKAHVFYHVNPSDYADFEENKHGFLFVFTKMLSMVKPYQGLKESELDFLGNMIYKTYIPLLESIKSIDREKTDRMFRHGMNSLLESVYADLIGE